MAIIDTSKGVRPCVEELAALEIYKEKILAAINSNGGIKPLYNYFDNAEKYASSGSANGLTYTVNSDGSTSISGSPTKITQRIQLTELASIEPTNTIIESQSGTIYYYTPVIVNVTWGNYAALENVSNTPVLSFFNIVTEDGVTHPTSVPINLSREITLSRAATLLPQTSVKYSAGFGTFRQGNTYNAANMGVMAFLLSDLGISAEDFQFLGTENTLSILRIADLPKIAAKYNYYCALKQQFPNYTVTTYDKLAPVSIFDFGVTQ